MDEDEATIDSGSDELDGGMVVVVVTERGLKNEAGDDTAMLIVEGTERREQSSDKAEKLQESAPSKSLTIGFARNLRLQ